MSNPLLPIVLPLSLHQEPKTAPSAPSARDGSAGAAGTATTQTPGQPVAPGAPEQTCGGPMQFGMMALFLFLMWAMVLRPESKRRKETQSMLAQLKQGDVVVTIGGMHGTVAEITDKTVVLRVGDARMTFDRSAISRVVRDEGRAGLKS